MIDHLYPLFVYGTLRRGQSNHRLLVSRYEQIVPGWIEGVELYSMDTFPMLVEGRGRVRGEVVYLCSDADAYAAALAVLDRLEGVDDADGPYRRVLKPVHMATGEETVAWVYMGRTELVRDRLQVVSGDWVAHLDGADFGAKPCEGSDCRL